ncbi:hypothetical protein HK098_005343 [Nowakowskiella sp. JEL0407]|nr:hypothetical protein HK098_005343 [Nowakowskiella sp. JEL0407]
MELFRLGVSGYRSVDNDDKSSVLRHRSPVTPSPKSFELSVLPSPTHSIKKNLQGQRFIRIVGDPKPYNATLIEHSEKVSIPSESTAAKPKDPKQKTTAHPEIQQTCKTITATTIDSFDPIIDILDSQNEEPFTLESFDDLIQLHAESGKDFIIARVKTDDPNDSSRSYYSYYAAHNINKVLFRTQPEEGLLHRMRAKNPLNNMTIIGDVHYYVSPSITPQSTSTFARSGSFEIFRKHKRPASADISKSIKSKPAKQNNSGIHELEDFKLNRMRNLISYSNELVQHQISPSDWITAHAASEISPQSETSKKSVIECYDAKYYASDDDFLINSSVRAYFKENALDSVDAVLFTITAENLDVSSEEVEQHPALRAPDNLVLLVVFVLIFFGCLMAVIFV